MLSRAKLAPLSGQETTWLMQMCVGQFEGAPSTVVRRFEKLGLIVRHGDGYSLTEAGHERCGPFRNPTRLSPKPAPKDERTGT